MSCSAWVAGSAVAAECRAPAGQRDATKQPSAGELRPLFNAIRHVETGGVANQRDAVGDKGRSIGPYQISRAYWTDSGVRGSWKRCKDQRHAEAAMLAYWKRYCPKALRSGDFETLARVHNGGPAGHRKAATADYWKSVQARLDS